MQPKKEDLTWKNYKCEDCGTSSPHLTNHYGGIFPFCPVCECHTDQICLEKAPEVPRGKPYQVKAGEFQRKTEK